MMVRKNETIIPVFKRPLLEVVHSFNSNTTSKKELSTKSKSKTKANTKQTNNHSKRKGKVEKVNDKTSLTKNVFKSPNKAKEQRVRFYIDKQISAFEKAVSPESKKKSEVEKYPTSEVCNGSYNGVRTRLKVMNKENFLIVNDQEKTYQKSTHGIDSCQSHDDVSLSKNNLNDSLTKVKNNVSKNFDLSKKQSTGKRKSTVKKEKKSLKKVKFHTEMVPKKMKNFTSSVDTNVNPNVAESSNINRMSNEVSEAFVKNKNENLIKKQSNESGCPKDNSKKVNVEKLKHQALKPSNKILKASKLNKEKVLELRKNLTKIKRKNFKKKEKKIEVLSMPSISSNRTLEVSFISTKNNCQVKESKIQVLDTDDIDLVIEKSSQPFNNISYLPENDDGGINKSSDGDGKKQDLPKHLDGILPKMQYGLENDQPENTFERMNWLSTFQHPLVILQAYCKRCNENLNVLKAADWMNHYSLCHNFHSYKCEICEKVYCQALHYYLHMQKHV